MLAPRACLPCVFVALIIHIMWLCRYERRAAEAHFSASNISPVTRKPLAVTDLFPNNQLRTVLEVVHVRVCVGVLVCSVMEACRFRRGASRLSNLLTAVACALTQHASCEREARDAVVLSCCLVKLLVNGEEKKA